MWVPRGIIKRSAGMGQGATRFPWARTVPRARRQQAEPVSYRCTRCSKRFKSSDVERTCRNRKCGGPVAVILALLGLLIVRPAAAQTFELGAYAAAAAADYDSTYLFLTKTHGREINPLGRPFDRHPLALVTVGASADALVTWYLYHRLESKPKLRRVILYAAAAGRFYLAAQNYRYVARYEGRR